MLVGIRQLIFIAVLLAVPVASYFLVFRPRNEEIARAKAEIDHKEALLAKLREATSQTADLERANSEIRDSIQAIEARLPTTKEIDSVLRDIAQIAARSNLRIPLFKKEEKSLQAGLALEQPLSVEITGDFDGFYAFLLELEKLPRITRIPDFTISRAEDADGNMKAKFTLSIYYQGEGIPNS